MVKHISYDEQDGVQLLHQLDNGIRLFNNGYGYVSDDEVHKICKFDEFACHNNHIFTQEKQIQRLTSHMHCKRSAEIYVDSILSQLQSWLTPKYINKKEWIFTTMPRNQKRMNLIHYY